MTACYEPNAITCPQLRMDGGPIYEIARLERLDGSLLWGIKRKIR